MNSANGKKCTCIEEYKASNLANGVFFVKYTGNQSVNQASGRLYKEEKREKEEKDRSKQRKRIRIKITFENGKGYHNKDENMSS